MIRLIDADREWESLVEKTPESSRFGALPRRLEHPYGSIPGFAPFGDAVDKLVKPADFKEVIAHCEEKQIFPVYHQHNTWAPPGVRWNQNGLPYCWIWGLAGNLMDCRAREGKPTVLLSPVSGGWMVNWREEGNYLEDAIRGVTERGLCEMRFTPDPHSRNYRQFLDGWEENALLYRIGAGEIWDLDNSSRSAMIQHSISVLATGTPIYIAYNWWGHALSCVGVRWDESVTNSLIWLIRNSHDEDDIIEMSGNKAVFDEAYAIRSTVTILGHGA